MTNYRNRIGEAIAFARNVAGRSQQELADMLGRDKRTIQKWERGEIRIALEDFLDVFDTLHLPVGPYEMWIRHPELFPRGMEDIKGFSTEKKRRTLADYYLHQAAPLEIEQEYYILFGDHGSNSCGIRQELLANLQTAKQQPLWRTWCNCKTAMVRCVKSRFLSITTAAPSLPCLWL